MWKNIDHILYNTGPGFNHKVVLVTIVTQKKLFVYQSNTTILLNRLKKQYSNYLFSKKMSLFDNINNLKLLQNLLKPPDESSEEEEDDRLPQTGSHKIGE